MSDLTAPWLQATERVLALAQEHRDPDALTEALGLPPGLREFGKVYGDEKKIDYGRVVLLVALGALLAREKLIQEALDGI